MEVKKTVKDDGTIEISVVVSPDETKKHVNAYYKKLNSKRIPGFRPGKAPRNVLNNLFGGKEAIYSEIATDMVNEIAPRAIDEQDIQFIENPKFEPLPKLEDEQDFKFVLAGPIKPAVKLSSYDAPTLKVPSSKATDEEIQAQIDMFSSYYYDFEEIKGRAVKKGDFVVLNFECVADGEPVPGLKDEERLMELGTEAMPQNFEKEIIGMKTGEKKDFDFSVKGEENYAFIGSDKVHAHVELKAIKEKKAPKIDDEFAKRLGADSLEKLKETLKSTIEREKEGQLAELKEKLIHEEIGKRVKDKLDKKFLDYTHGVSLYDFYNNLQRQGLTFDQLLESEGISKEEFEKDFRQQSDELAHQSLALDAIAAEKGIKVTQEDIDKEFNAAENPEETKQKWTELGRMSEIREAILRKKASEWLKENAKFEELKPGEKLDDKDKSASKKNSEKSTEKKTAKSSSKTGATSKSASKSKSVTKTSASTKSSTEKKTSKSKKDSDK